MQIAIHSAHERHAEKMIKQKQLIAICQLIPMLSRARIEFVLFVPRGISTVSVHTETPRDRYTYVHVRFVLGIGRKKN